MPTETAPEKATLPTETLSINDFMPPNQDAIADYESMRTAAPAPKAEEKAVDDKKGFDVEGTFTEALDQFKREQLEAKAKVAPEDLKKTETKPDPITEKPAEKAKETASDVTGDMTDAQLDKLITEASKDMTKGQREVFRHKNYEIRGLKRQVQEAEQLKAKLAEYEKRTADGDTTQAVQKELEAMKSRVEEQERELAGTRLEATQEFRAKIHEPMHVIENGFKKIAEDFELDASAIIEAANSSGKERGARLAELAADMTDYDRRKFYEIADRYSDLREQRSAMMERAKENYDSLQQQRKEAEAAAAADYVSKKTAAVDPVWKKIVETAPILSEKQGDATHNEKLKAYKDFATKADFTKYPVDQQVEILHRAATWPALNGVVKELQAQKAELEARINEMRGVVPNAGGRSEPGKAAASDADENMGFTEAFNRALASGEFSR